MKFVDVIRKAENEHVIYFLLNSYIGIARDRDRLKRLPDKVTTLPLANKSDLRCRFEILICELDIASKRLDDEKCILIKEALVVFGTALYSLQSIGCQQSRPQNFAIPQTQKPTFSDAINRTHAP